MQYRSRSGRRENEEWETAAVLYMKTFWRHALSLSCFAIIVILCSCSDEPEASQPRPRPPPPRDPLPSAVRAEVKAKLQQRLSNSSIPPLYTCIGLFDETRTNHVGLSKGQLFEVASILGNAMKLNAQCFMLYQNGIPKQSRVLENPDFDYRDTSQNIPDY